MKTSLASTACIFIFGFAIFLCYLTVSSELVYIQRGVFTDGVVLEKMKETTHRTGSFASSSWHVVYEFKIDGRAQKNKYMLDVGRGFDSIKNGDEISILYDPKNPAISRPHMASPWIRYSGIIFFILAMSLMFAYVPIKILRQR